MTCDEAQVLLHALIDGELDAGHSREVEAHIANCPDCAAQLGSFRDMRGAIGAAQMNLKAPAALRQRIEAALPQPRASSRRAVLQGFAMGSAVSAIAATGLFAVFVRDDDDRRIGSELLSAHLRSLRSDHLIDVVSSDQHTVKPWFNGRLDVSPPVVDLTAQGFSLLGGRLDYVDGRAVAAIVYRRRTHIINLFVLRTAAASFLPAHVQSNQGFNIRRWSENGLSYWAVSDVEPDELSDFAERFEKVARSG